MKEKFAISLFSRLSAQIITIIASYLLALNLEVYLFGFWFFLNSIINLGFIFVDIGLDTIHYQYSGKRDFAQYFGTFFIIKIILILINSMITLILIIILQLWDPIYLIYFFLLLSSQILTCIIKIFIINLKSKILIFKAEIPSLLIIIGRNLSIIYLTLNMAYFADPLLYICISGLIFDFILIVIILIISRNHYKIIGLKRDLIFKYINDVKPLIIQSIVIVIATNLGNLILAYSFGYEALGYFSIVNIYIISVLLIISGSIIPIYLTLFSRYFEKNEVSAVKKIIYIIEKYYSIFFLFLIIIVILNGYLMFSIFLPKYIYSVQILYIMIFIPYLIGLSRPYPYLLVSIKKIKIAVYVNSLNYMLMIILLIIFIPKQILFVNTLGLGALGYALALTIPWIIWTILIRYFSYKYIGVKFQKKLILHIILAFFTLLISIILKNIISKILIQNQILLLVFTSLIALGIFLGLLFFFKELNREDIKFFLDIINLLNYKRSLAEEFTN